MSHLVLQHVINITTCNKKYQNDNKLNELLVNNEVNTIDNPDNQNDENLGNDIYDGEFGDQNLLDEEIDNSDNNCQKEIPKKKNVNHKNSRNVGQDEPSKKDINIKYEDKGFIKRKKKRDNYVRYDIITKKRDKYVSYDIMFNSSKAAFNTSIKKAIIKKVEENFKRKALEIEESNLEIKERNSKRKALALELKKIKSKINADFKMLRENFVIKPKYKLQKVAFKYHKNNNYDGNNKYINVINFYFFYNIVGDIDKVTYLDLLKYFQKDFNTGYYSEECISLLSQPYLKSIADFIHEQYLDDKIKDEKDKPDFVKGIIYYFKVNKCNDHMIEDSSHKKDNVTRAKKGPLVGFKKKNFI